MLDSQGRKLKKLAWKFERVKHVGEASEGLDEGLGDGPVMELSAPLDVLAMDDGTEEVAATLTVISVTPGS